MGYVVQASLKQISNVIVVQGIEDLPALSPPANQSQVAQRSELMRYCRLAHFQSRRQVADTQLGTCKQ
jgi:hypothetical protein